MEEPVTIVDRDVLKVLSVDTRMDILKELSEGARTPSHLSKRLEKSDATIVEHLDILVKSGLVKRIEQPGRKWIFYTLTNRGIGIVSSKSKRLIIILSTSVLALIGGFISFGKYYLTQFGHKMAMEAARAPMVGAGEGVVPAVQIPTYLYLSIIFFAISVPGFIFYSAQKSKFKKMRV